ncbi:hypothetical protein IEQ34_009412 [Dendrobium chrysotoxum]|uniref:Uncharacterized protein n=1 Tax=Dendrobium chrysotoxum TaxID=161865 RepID=A0AAV7H1Y7_DENCH|nr:hypothetical protein IEQ34_009412 [Dendrobium chrysotoxum]
MILKKMVVDAFHGGRLGRNGLRRPRLNLCVGWKDKKRECYCKEIERVEIVRSEAKRQGQGERGVSGGHPKVEKKECMWGAWNFCVMESNVTNPDVFVGVLLHLHGSCKWHWNLTRFNFNLLETYNFQASRGFPGVLMSPPGSMVQKEIDRALLEDGSGDCLSAELNGYLMVLRQGRQGKICPIKGTLLFVLVLFSGSYSDMTA